MIRSLLSLALLLCALPLAAETVVTCDPDSPVVPNRVTFYATSVHGPAYPGSLLDPDLSAVTGLPWQQWKCNGTDVVPMSAQDLADLAAADLAARQAIALAAYGQAGCDLTGGDELIGQCSAGDVLTSPLFEAAVLDVIKRRLSVADGEYLRRQGNAIVGYPALPSGARIEVAGPVAINGVEAAIATLADVVLNKSTSRVLLIGKVDLVKDGGTTARVVTLRIRRGGDNAVIGEPTIVRSQTVASSDFGPAHLLGVDINPGGPGLVTYGITATTPAGSPTGARIVLVAVEVQ